MYKAQITATHNDSVVMMNNLRKVMAALLTATRDNNHPLHKFAMEHCTTLCDSGRVMLRMTEYLEQVKDL